MLIITTLSLLMAATLGWVALRLLREEQRRSEARVMALTAALDEPWPQAGPPSLSPEPVSPVVQPHRPVEDMTSAAAPSRELPSRALPPREVPTVVAIDDADMRDAFFDNAPPAPDEPTSEGSVRPMFGADVADAPPQDDRRWLAIAAVVLVGLGVTSVLWSTSGGAGSAASPVVAAATPGGVPLELVSLGHERTDAGLVVRGLVRNPVAGSTRTGTGASVFLFDGTGGFLGSGRAVLDTPTLAPGDEAAFEVTLPNNANVRRYRVTFRNMDGTVASHTDKRQTPAGQE